MRLARPTADRAAPALGSVASVAAKRTGRLRAGAAAALAFAGPAFVAAILVVSAPQGSASAREADGAVESRGLAGLAVVGPDTADAGLRLVVLGTGTPNADPERSGPALAVIAGERAYLVDAGPGIVRRAAAARARHGIEALDAARLDRLFVTHLHSDHTVGLPDVILSPWVLDRPRPIRIHGPPGTAAMVAAIHDAWREDIHMRLFGLEPREANPDAYQADVHESTGGPVYEDENVSVTAIPVRHGSWPHALGYKFEAAGRSVVVSGDARPSPVLADACDGCDILVHEVYSARRFETRPPEWQRYHARAHTSTAELAELAGQARPRLLVLYHQLYWGASDEDLLAELREAGYAGAAESAADLDVYSAERAARARPERREAREPGADSAAAEPPALRLRPGPVDS